MSSIAHGNGAKGGTFALSANEGCNHNSNLGSERGAKGENFWDIDHISIWEEKHRAEFSHFVSQSSVVDFGVGALILWLEGSGWDFG